MNWHTVVVARDELIQLLVTIRRFGGSVTHSLPCPVGAKHPQAERRVPNGRHPEPSFQLGDNAWPAGCGRPRRVLISCRAGFP
jgi:hypothetical protein